MDEQEPMIYEEPLKHEHQEEYLRGLLSDDQPMVCKALIDLAFYADDPGFIQSCILYGLGNSDPAIKQAALVACTHVVMRFGSLDTQAFLPIILSYQDDPELHGFVSDLIEDITKFWTEGESPSL